MKKQKIIYSSLISFFFTHYASAGKVTTATGDFPEWRKPKLVYKYFSNPDQEINLKPNEKNLSTKYWQTPHGVVVSYYGDEDYLIEKYVTCTINGGVPKISDWNSYKTVEFNVTYDKPSELFNCEGEATYK
jgi:hypothetical protein